MLESSSGTVWFRAAVESDMDCGRDLSLRRFAANPVSPNGSSSTPTVFRGSRCFLYKKDADIGAEARTLAELVLRGPLDVTLTTRDDSVALPSIGRCAEHAALRCTVAGVLLDVTRPTANKGVIIERLARYLKIPMEAIATIGDQRRVGGRRRHYRETIMTIGTGRPPAGRLPNKPAWKARKKHHRNVRAVHLRELFARDPGRGERLTVEAAGVYLDYSKNRITDETVPLLVALAEDCGLRARIDAMFRGEKINVSEKRAVLHVALRAPRGASILVDGKNVVPEVHAVLDRMADFANRVRSGAWKGHTGQPIRNIVNIGIGGSDLGPVMAYEALKALQRPQPHLPVRLEHRWHGLRRSGPRSRPGGDALHRVVQDLHDAGNDDQRPHRARVVAGGRPRRRRGVGREALRRGLDQCRGSGEVRHRHRQHVRVLGLGRRALLHGLGDRPLDDAGDRPGSLPRDARRLPRDGRTLPHRAPFAQNLPVLMGLLGIWNTNFFGAQTVAVLPYEQYLKRFPRLPPAVDDGEQRQARDARRRRGLVRDRADLLGRAGHQRPALLLSADPPGDAAHPLRLHRVRRDAQPARPAPRRCSSPTCSRRARRWPSARRPRKCEAKARRTGWSPIGRFGGNRPSNTILLPRLTPAALGKLVALYEHIVFTQGVIWNVDSFDQWGVELGKVLAQRIIPELGGSAEPPLNHDSSTNALIRRYRKARVAAS